jgi:hypothetical protein
MLYYLPGIIAPATGAADKSGIKNSIKRLRVAEIPPARGRGGQQGCLCRCAGAKTVSFRFSGRYTVRRMPFQ